jgi:hypothetical protein
MNRHPVAQPSKNPQACLVALPNELQVYVAKYLGRKELFSLGMVNRNLSDIAIPLIYACGIDTSMSPKARAACISRIDEDSKLARLVKKIHFRYAFSKPMKYQRGVGLQGQAPGTLVLNEQLAAIHDKATKLELEHLATLLIAAMNVEELGVYDLSYRAVDVHRMNFLDWVHLVSTSTMPVSLGVDQPFQHLKVFKASCSSAIVGCIRLANIVPILTLPRLEELHLKAFIEILPPAPNTWECHPKTSNIKKLKLHYSFLHWQVVCQLVQSCKALEVFHYSYKVLKSPRHGLYPIHGWAPHSWPHIWHALQNHKTSLQQLELGYTVKNSQLAAAALFHQVYAWQIGPLGSLADFNQLKYIAAPVDALVATPGFPQCLPTSLEILSLRYDETTELAEERCIQGIVTAIATNKQAGRKLGFVRLALSDGVPFRQYSIQGCKEAAIRFRMTRSLVHWMPGKTIYRAG